MQQVPGKPGDPKSDEESPQETEAQKRAKESKAKEIVIFSESNKEYDDCKTEHEKSGKAE